MSIWNADQECLDREERQQRQWEHLQVTLNRAYKNVPFYRNRFRDVRIDPYQVETLEDFRRIPFTERRHFSDQYPYGLFALPLRDIVRIHTAPGTGRNPTVSGYTRGDLQVWREMVARALKAADVGADDILQVILDPGLANWARDYKDGAESIGASVIPLNTLHLKKQLMVLRDYKTSVLISTASSAVQLTDLMFRTNLNPNELALRLLILVGEPPDETAGSLLREQLHVTTWSHYGLSEIPGPTVAFECEEHQGLHMNEDHFLAEILEPEFDKQVSEGDSGELVLTTLSTRAFPLIRFRTGDRARILPEPCPCGRTLRRIEWLPQRTDHMLVLRGVKLHQEQVLAHIEQVLGAKPVNWRILLADGETGKELEVRIAMNDDLFSDEIKELERIVWQLESELFQELGVPVSVSLKETLD